MIKDIRDFNGHCLHYLAQVAINGIPNLEGDVIELGAGYNSLLMGSLLRTYQSDKKVFSCDCFKGLPYSDNKKIFPKSNLYKGQWLQGSEEDFIAEIKNMGLENYVFIVPGLIENTLKSNLKDEIFCFAWCDLDLYKSTFTAYKFLEDRIVKGGILGFHDYERPNCPGVKKVIDKILNREKYKKIYQINTTIFFQKRIKGG